MKQTPLKRKTPLRAYSTLQRRTPLKSYAHLTSNVGLKRTPFKSTGSTLKRTSIHKAPPTKQKTLDSIISKVVRLGSANENGFVKCATCPVVKHWKEMQCGHFQKRGNLMTRYDMQNLAPQCEDCNCFNDGMEKEFAEFIDGFYGSGTAETLRVKAQHVCYDFPYEQEIIKWKAVLNNLLESRSSRIVY